MYKDEEIQLALAAGGLRMTSHRFCIMEYLLRRMVHSTVEEIFQAVNRPIPEHPARPFTTVLTRCPGPVWYARFPSPERPLYLTPICAVIITFYVTIAARWKTSSGSMRPKSRRARESPRM